MLRFKPVGLAGTIIAAVLVAGCGGHINVTPTTAAGSTGTSATVTAAAASGPATPETFSGNGAKSIRITVHQPSTMRWTCRGCGAFAADGSTSDGASIIAVSSTGQSGSSAVDPGVYRSVQIIATAAWTIRITPG